jgi:PAS domain S-box-containing protein
MRPHLTRLFLLFIMLVLTPVLARAAAQHENAVVLHNEQEKYLLGRNLEILRDPGGQLTFEDISSSDYEDQFFDSQVDTPNFGYQSAVYWVRFHLINQSTEMRDWVLELGFANMHYLDLYLPEPGGDGYEERQTGILLPVQSREIPFHHFAFKLEIPPGGEQTIYMRFQNNATMTLPLTLWTERAFTGHMQIDQLASGVYYGALFILLFHNLFLFFLFRQRVYAFLVLFIFTFTCYWLFYDGYILQFIQINNPRWATTPLLIFMGLALVFLIRFVDSLTELAAQAPSLHRSGNVFIGLTLLILLFAPFIEYRVIGFILLIIVIAAFIAILVLNVYLLRKNFRPARYLFASLFWFLIGGILTALVRLSILPSMTFTESITQVGVVWMAVVWSLALTDNIHILKDETIAANHKLQESEARISQFLDAVPVGVVVYGTDLRARYLNRESKRLLTNPDGSIAPDPTMRRRLPEAMAYFSFRVRGTGNEYPMQQMPMTRALRGEPTFLDDIEFDRGDRRIPVESWGSPLFDSDGNITGAIVAFQDISDRIEKEAILQESEERFRVTFEQAAVGIAHVSTEGRFVRINQQFCEIVGYSREEMIALTFQELTHPDDLEADLQMTDELMKGEIGSFSREKRYLRKSGEIVWVNLTVSLLREKTGEPKYFISVIQDIDKRKAVEKRLQFQAYILDAIEQAVIVTDMQGNVVYWNPYAEQLYGWSAQEAIGKTMVDLIGSQPSMRLCYEIMDDQQRGESWSDECLARRRDGSILAIHISNTPIYDDQGVLQHIIGISSDITERKRVEEALHQSQELQQLAVTGAQLGIWSTDLVTGEIYWDARTREIFGVPADARATLDLGFSLIHPDDREVAKAAFERAIGMGSDGYYAEEKRIVRPDGHMRWIQTKGNAVFANQNSVQQAVNLVGVVLDITNRKEAEHSLEESRIRYKQLIEAMRDGLVDVDEKGFISYANPRMAEMLGYTQEEIVGCAIFQFFSREMSEIISDQLDRRRKGEIDPYTITWQRKDGSILHTLNTPAPVFDEQGQFIRSIVVVTDISEQVQASQLLEQRVAERTKELTSLLELSQIVTGSLELMPLVTAILEKLKQVVNFSGAAVFSLLDNSLISQSFHIQVSPQAAKEIVRPYNQPGFIRPEYWHEGVILLPDVMENSEGLHKFRTLTASVIGGVLPADMRSWMGIPLWIKDKIVGVLSVHYGEPGYYTPEMVRLVKAYANQTAVIVENSWLYRQAKAAAAAEERSRLARELHDSVTQSLYGLALYAKAAQSALAAGKVDVATKHLEEVQASAQEGMADLRLLIFELRPILLETKGLIAALDERLRAVEKRLDCNTIYQVRGNSTLSLEVETDLYWAINEALNNVLKHASATQVILDLHFKDAGTCIIIQDNGVGFNPAELPLSSGLGFKNINDRIERLGGNLKITSQIGKGTAVEIKLGNWG